MSAPTPRTDAESFYPHDSKEKVTDSLFAQQLERELAALTAERDQLRADCENETKWAAHYLAQSIADKSRAEKAEADLAAAKERLRSEAMDDYASIKDLQRELATERARLDSGQILLTVAGERVWHCGVDLRAAIDAAMKEGGA